MNNFIIYYLKNHIYDKYYLKNHILFLQTIHTTNTIFTNYIHNEHHF